MNRQDIIGALNKDLADELAAITQYMWHHVMVKGVDATAVAPLFRQAALDEMRHAELLAERIAYLGGTPVHSPAGIQVGGELEEMVRQDLAGERAAIKQYKEHIRLCQDDPGTRRLLEDILMDEERHEDMWASILTE